MRNLQLTMWFGLSFTLHLAAASGLIAVASRNAELKPKTMVVVLDNLDSPSLPEHKLTRAAVQPVVRPVTPVSQATQARSKPVEVKPEPVQLKRQPLLLPDHVTQQTSENKRNIEISKESPEHTATFPGQASPVSSAPPPVQQTASAAAEVPSTEKVQQRYLKEHFTYIRELIMKKLVYPPLARKMNWSGKAVVSFTITDNGSVQGIRVTETSGFPILDKSALEAVRVAEPFPKPPVRAEIAVPINFKMMK